MTSFPEQETCPRNRSSGGMQLMASGGCGHRPRRDQAVTALLECGDGPVDGGERGVVVPVQADGVAERSSGVGMLVEEHDDWFGVGGAVYTEVPKVLTRVGAETVKVHGGAAALCVQLVQVDGQC